MNIQSNASTVSSYHGSLNGSEDEGNHLNTRSSRTSIFKGFQASDEGVEYYIDLEPGGSFKCKFLLAPEKVVKQKVNHKSP